MTSINSQTGPHVQVPRELSLLFKDNPGAQRAFNAFLQALAAKVTGSNSTLEEIEQRGGNPTISRFHELEKRIDRIETQLRAQRRDMETIKRVDSVESSARKSVNVNEIIKRLDDVDASARPRS